MRQLVQLGEQSKEFKTLNTEIICIFREEDNGVEGLKKTKEQTKTPFTLAFDNDKKTTGAYSGKKMTFDNYVIDKAGNIRAFIPGTLKKRAKAEQLMKHLRAIQE